jgi:hypothetical protein
MGSDPQQLFGVGLGTRLAGERGRKRWLLEMMHDDHQRWVGLGQFQTKDDAERALAKLGVPSASLHRYRIRKAAAS